METILLLPIFVPKVETKVVNEPTFTITQLADYLKQTTVSVKQMQSAGNEDESASKALDRLTSAIDKLATTMGGITQKVCEALHDYDPRAIEDLGFKRGDKLVIIDDTVGDSEVGDWWQARLVGGTRVGYVPSNYLSVASFAVEQSEGEEFGFGD